MNRDVLLNILSKIVVNMIVLILSSKIFSGLYYSNVFYLFLASIIIMVLNIWVKPFLKYIMLPINIYTLGLTYPLINVFVLKLTSLILYDKFILSGWINAFFISIFISIMSIILDKYIGKSIRGEVK